LRATIGASRAFGMTGSLFAFLHHAAAFALFGSLFAELMLIKIPLTATTARSLLRADTIYGASAGIIIVVGLVRVYFTEKGADYYLHSATFIAKIVLFVIIGLISIYPTRRFISWRRDLREGRTPVLDEATQTTVRKIIHAELGLLMIVILCAVLMARGIGS
jgi:putative membrane protein